MLGVSRSRRPPRIQSGQNKLRPHDARVLGRVVGSAEVECRLGVVVGSVGRWSLLRGLLHRRLVEAETVAGAVGTRKHYQEEDMICNMGTAGTPNFSPPLQSYAMGLKLS